MIDFPDNFLFSIFSHTLKYVNMIRISNIPFSVFDGKMNKIDWPKSTRTINHQHPASKPAHRLKMFSNFLVAVSREALCLAFMS